MNLLMAWMPPPDGINRARRDDTSPRSAHKRSDDHQLRAKKERILPIDVSPLFSSEANLVDRCVTILSNHSRWIRLSVLSDFVAWPQCGTNADRLSYKRRMFTGWHAPGRDRRGRSNRLERLEF